MWRQILSYLWPEHPERDPGFRREVLRQSRLALLIIGGIQVAVSLFMVAARYFVTPESSTLPFRFRQAAIIIGLGVVNAAAWRVKALERWARLIAAITGLTTISVLIWASLLILSESTNPDDFIPGQITLVMLVAVTIVPLQPVHTFLMGGAIGAIYIGSTTYAHEYLHEGTGPDNNYLLFIFMLTLLCTGLTAVVYAQRVSNFELRQAQTRSLLAENANSLARLAAALSHELNNPIGALLSGVDTMLLLASRQATTSEPTEQQRLVLLQSDLRKGIQQSAERLRMLVSRMQRFTHLDQAEVQQADVNEMLSDVVALVQADPATKARIRMNLEPLPPLVCKPAQISAVFSSLITNAVEAVDAGGEVTVTTQESGKNIVIDICDTGHGVDPSELSRIFDPSFKVDNGRVAAGNWSMFASRQIVREHGGEIKLRSMPGEGTDVRITFAAARAMSLT